MANKTKKLVAYKGFDKNLKCRDFQYEIGKTYTHEGKVIPCQSGFHACKNPLDVLEYYPLIDSNGEINKFAEVEAEGEIKTEGNKLACGKITLKSELSISRLITASVDFAFKAIKFDTILKRKNDDSQLASSGDDSKLASSGDDSKLASSGNNSKLASSGDDSKLASSGDDSKLASSGARGVLVGVERESRFKGSLGTLVCLCHYLDGKVDSFVTGKIGERGLKADTWYTLDEKGKFQEVKS